MGPYDSFGRMIRRTGRSVLLRRILVRGTSIRSLAFEDARMLAGNSFGTGGGPNCVPMVHLISIIAEIQLSFSLRKKTLKLKILLSSIRTL